MKAGMPNVPCAIEFGSASRTTRPCSMKAKAKKLAELANEGGEPDATGKARVEHYVGQEKDALRRKKKVLTALAERETEAD